MKNIKKIVAIGLVLFFLINGSFAQLFLDIPKAHWAKDYIEALYEEGVFMGRTLAHFAPDENVTNQELAVILTRILKPQKEELSAWAKADEIDMERFKIAAYAKESVAYMWHKQIMVEGVFYENGQSAAVKREDFCVYMIRLLGLEEEAKEAEENQSVEPFQDHDGIGRSKRGYVYLAREKGIIQGDESGYFNPQREVTRAEAAKMIYFTRNLLEAIEEGDEDEKSSEDRLLSKGDGTEGRIKFVRPSYHGFLMVLATTEGQNVSLNIKRETPFYRGAQLDTLLTLSVGETVKIETDEAGDPVAIWGESVEPVFLKGKIWDLLSDEKGIVFKRDEENKTSVYFMDENTLIYVAGVAKDAEFLLPGQRIQLIAEHQYIKIIQIESQP